MVFLKIAMIPLATLLATVSTCNKDRAARSKEQMLTANEWKLDEVARNSEGRNSHYKRNGENTTKTNYDVIRIKFKENGSGTYTADNGETYSMIWRFSSADKHEMQITVDYGNSATYNWKLVEITPGALYNTTAFNDRGNQLLLTARFVPALQ